MAQKCTGLTVIVCAILLVFGLIVKAKVAFSLPLHSDSVQAAIYFYDIVGSRNYFLQNWLLPINPYIVPDVLVYFALGKLFGMEPFTLKLGALLIFIFSILALALVVKRVFGLTEALISAAVVSCSSLFTAKMLVQPLIHIGTIGFAFMCFYILIKIVDTRDGETTNAHYHVLLFITSALVTFSDPFFAFTFSLPALAALIILRLAKTPLLGRSREAALWLPITLGPATGVLLQRVVELFDIFIVKSISTRTVASGWLGQSISHYSGSVLRLFGADFMTAGLSTPEILFKVTNAVLLAGVLVGFMLALRKMKNGEKKFTVIYLVMLVALLSVSFIIQEKPLDAGTSRYLTPLIYVFSVFFSLIVSGEYIRSRALASVFIFLLVISATYSGRSSLNYRAEQSHAGLAGFLKASGLRYGYSLYWDANIVTFLTGNEVKVRPMKLKNGGLAPHNYLIKVDWFKPSPHNGPTFLILPVEQKYENTALSPSTVLYYDGYQILVWQLNIMNPMPKKDAAPQ